MKYPRYLFAAAAIAVTLAGCTARSGTAGVSAGDGASSNPLIGKWTSPADHSHDREFTPTDWIDAGGQHHKAFYHLEVHVREGGGEHSCEFPDSKHMQCPHGDNMFIYERAAGAGGSNPILGRWTGGGAVQPDGGEYTAAEWIDSAGKHHAVSYQFVVSVTGDEMFDCTFPGPDTASCTPISGRNGFEIARVK